MLFTVKKRKTLSLFEGLLKKTTKELNLKIGKKTYTKNDLFYEMLKSQMPIREFESNSDTISRDTQRKKGNFLLMMEYMNGTFKWKGYSYPLFIYKYLYNKAKVLIHELRHIAKKEEHTLSFIIESYNPRLIYNENTYLWKLNAKEIYKKYKEENNTDSSIQSISSKDAQMTNIIVNIPKQFNERNNNDITNESKLIFQGKICRLFIENKNPYSVRKNKLMSNQNNIVYNQTPKKNRISQMFTTAKKTRKRITLSRIDTNDTNILPDVMKYTSPTQGKHRRIFSTELTQSNTSHTTKYKSCKEVISFKDTALSKKKPLRLVLKNNNFEMSNKYKLGKNDFFFS